MDTEDKRKLCRAALDLPASGFSQWEAGFLHGVTYGARFISDEFYTRLQNKLPKDKE